MDAEGLETYADELFRAARGSEGTGAIPRTSRRRRCWPQGVAVWCAPPQTSIMTCCGANTGC